MHTRSCYTQASPPHQHAHVYFLEADSSHALSALVKSIQVAQPSNVLDCCTLESPCGLILPLLHCTQTFALQQHAHNSCQITPAAPCTLERPPGLIMPLLHRDLSLHVALYKSPGTAACVTSSPKPCREAMPATMNLLRSCQSPCCTCPCPWSRKGLVQTHPVDIRVTALWGLAHQPQHLDQHLQKGCTYKNLDARCILHGESGIQHLEFCTRLRHHRAACIMHRACLMCPVSRKAHPVSCILHPTSSISHPESHIQHLASCIPHLTSRILDHNSCTCFSIMHHVS